MAAKRKPINSRPGTVFGPLQQVFDDIWWAWGTVRFMPGITFPRNMTIIRERGELVLVHPVMMPDDVQRQIEALGPIKHIVRLGNFHGMDDAKYIAKYDPVAWAPPGVELSAGARIDRELVPGGPTPFSDGTVFSFTAATAPEVAIHLARHGGVLLTCDSVQNWETTTGCSFLGGAMAGMMGFKGRACVGPGWRKVCEPKDGVGFRKDFERLVALEWKHLLSAHGQPMHDTARDDLRATLAKLYR